MHSFYSFCLFRRHFFCVGYCFFFSVFADAKEIDWNSLIFFHFALFWRLREIKSGRLKESEKANWKHFLDTIKRDDFPSVRLSSLIRWSKFAFISLMPFNFSSVRDNFVVVAFSQNKIYKKIIRLRASVRKCILCIGRFYIIFALFGAIFLVNFVVPPLPFMFSRFFIYLLRIFRIYIHKV